MTQTQAVKISINSAEPIEWAEFVDANRDAMHAREFSRIFGQLMLAGEYIIRGGAATAFKITLC